MEESEKGGAASTEQSGEGSPTKQNVISNLPLIFANGYPTSLERITAEQLKKFIPFMVQCSLGHAQSNPVVQQPLEELPQPKWWPSEDIPFSASSSFERPASYTEDEWTRKLKELVCMCYEYHNNVFLLRFCNVLSNYEPECLRFINNYNSTTSIYDRFNNKLLVTFRNENMLYDKQYNANRICLLPRRKSRAVPGIGSTDVETDVGDGPDEACGPLMVEPPLFDIYLCDYCDAELYSLEACREHERTCREADADSDVILCEDDDDEVPVRPTDPTSQASTIASAVKLRNRKRITAKEATSKRVSAQNQRYSKTDRFDYQPSDQEDSKDGSPAESSSGPDQMQTFLMQHFQLMSTTASGNKLPSVTSPKKNGRIGTTRSPTKSAANDKKRRNDRSMLTLNRCAAVPLTSPMGKFLLKRQKTMICREYMLERMDRMERFCPAPAVKEFASKPRWLTLAMAGPTEHCPVTYRATDYRGPGYDSTYVHKFIFPRRQFSRMSRELGWLELTRVLLRNCRPCSVNLVRMTESDIRMHFLNLAIEKKKRELMELQRADFLRLYMHQLKRPVECIDLCSSSSSGEEQDDDDDNDDLKKEVGNSRRTGDDSKCSVLGNTPSVTKRMKLDGGGGGEAKENCTDGGGGAADTNEISSTDGGGEGQLEVASQLKGDSSPALIHRYVKILPKTGLSEIMNKEGSFPPNLQIERNHSAIQSTTNSDYPAQQPQQQQIIPVSMARPTAQLGVAWPSAAVASVAPPVNKLQSPLIPVNIKFPTIQLVPMQSTPSTLVLQPSGSINCQPSYLFLTKQDILYQQPPPPSVSAFKESPQAVGVTNTGTNLPANAVLTNSTINGVRSPSKVGYSIPEVAHSNLRTQSSQPILMPKTSPHTNSGPSTQEKVDDHSSRTTTTAAQKVLENPVSRRSTTTVCESFVGLPKKLPSLIRIAPAAIGGK